jgi:hypothetical protein
VWRTLIAAVVVVLAVGQARADSLSNLGGVDGAIIDGEYYNISFSETKSDPNFLRNPTGALDAANLLLFYLNGFGEDSVADGSSFPGTVLTKPEFVVQDSIVGTGVLVVYATTGWFVQCIDCSEGSPIMTAIFAPQGQVGVVPIPTGLPLFATGLGARWVCSAGAGNGEQQFDSR